MPDTVNPQITDAVTQANTKVIGEAPAMAMAAIYQSLAHSTGLLFENAVNAQAQMAITAQAATTQGVMSLYTIDTVAMVNTAEKLLNPEEQQAPAGLPDGVAPLAKAAAAATTTATKAS